MQEFNADFILGASGQLSDDATGTTFCSAVLSQDNYMTAVGDTATLTGKEFLADGTKCTWQIATKGDVLSSVKLTAASEVGF